MVPYQPEEIEFENFEGINFKIAQTLHQLLVISNQSSQIPAAIPAGSNTPIWAFVQKRTCRITIYMLNYSIRPMAILLDLIYQYDLYRVASTWEQPTQ